MATDEFDFEAEFALLDVGATSSMLRAGSVRTSVLAFTAEAGVEAITLDWSDDTGLSQAFEEARRCLRDRKPAAYALIAHLARHGRTLTYLLPGGKASAGSEFLALCMFTHDGAARGVLYPVRRAGRQISFGMPSISDADSTDWCPLGDVWGNPFCVGDLVRFTRRDRAVEPGTPLWQSLVDLTRLRIHDDQANADEYMGFLDDLRNGLFVVAGRPQDRPSHVLLRPRTVFNPLGTLEVEASRLVHNDDEAASETGKVAAS